MLDVRKLRMLAALDRLGTVAAVADELHLTASGVSMQLAALEREAGVPLTRRRGRRVELTPAGVVLARHGRDLVDRLSLAEHELAALRVGAVGTYAVTAFPSAARTLVAEALPGLADGAAAGLEVRLTTEEPEGAIEALLAGRTDLAIIHSYSNVPRDLPPGVSGRPLGSERVHLAVPAGGGISPRLADHAERPWIAPPPELTCATMVDRACGLAGFRPRVVARSIDFASQLAWVGAGLGVALVPELAWSVLPDGVVLVEPEPPVRRHLHLAARTSDWTDPGLEVVAAALTASAQRLLPSAVVPDR